MQAGNIINLINPDPIVNQGYCLNDLNTLGLSIISIMVKDKNANTPALIVYTGIYSAFYFNKRQSSLSIIFSLLLFA